MKKKMFGNHKNILPKQIKNLMMNSCMNECVCCAGKKGDQPRKTNDNY